MNRAIEATVDLIAIGAFIGTVGIWALILSGVA